jgi:hypothetical protein
MVLAMALMSRVATHYAVAAAAHCEARQSQRQDFESARGFGASDRCHVFCAREKKIHGSFINRPPDHDF